MPADRANRARTTLGIDATQVRVHDGPEAATSAEDRGMAAFTVGQDVVLGDRARGAGLAQDAILAHELVHVAQQSGAHDDAGVVAPGSSSAERDAEMATPGVTAALAGDSSAGQVRRPGRSGLALQGCPKQEVDETKARIQALETRRAGLTGTTTAGSGATFGEVGAAFTELKDVEHDLAVARTGKGIYAGSKSGDTTSATISDCTEIVKEVLRDTFAQQGRSAEWTKILKVLKSNTKLRGGGGPSGLDLQAALQSELGWKGIFWAPDSKFAYQDEDVSGVKGTEASYTSAIAKSAGTYYKDFGKKGYPGVKVHQQVTNYGPEKGSTTTKDDSQLKQLRKLKFGVMSANGARHMTILASGKVIEVHWKEPSSSADVITQTPLEDWAIGSSSGIRYFISGVIVAPAEEVDKAFQP